MNINNENFYKLTDKVIEAQQKILKEILAKDIPIYYNNPQGKLIVEHPDGSFKFVEKENAK